MKIEKLIFLDIKTYKAGLNYPEENFTLKLLELAQ